MAVRRKKTTCKIPETGLCMSWDPGTQRSLGTEGGKEGGRERGVQRGCQEGLPAGTRGGGFL